ncbi:MAG TPA: hypothetical protein VGG19_14000 [Tepidisphaeraceae bacterium]|jgi:hypothetical protein
MSRTNRKNFPFERISTAVRSSASRAGPSPARFFLGAKTPRLFYLPTLFALIALNCASCNRDRSETVDTSILSAPSAPQPEDTSPGNSTAPPSMAGGDQSAMAAPAESSDTAAAPARPAPITYQLPAGWSQQPGTDMRFATLTGPQHIQIAVTVFPGDVGGTLANINRWRKQMGIAPVTQDQLSKTIISVSTSNGSAVLTDLTNQDQRLLAAMINTQNQTWVFKMTGPTQLVGKYAPDFLSILKSVSIPQ